jgi:glucokinase
MTVFVGVDVGGTKTAIGAVAFPDARVLRREELPTPPREATGAAFLDEVARRANALAEEAGAKGIGVSICELVAPDGEIRSAHRVMWQGLGEAFQHPVVVEADVRAGAVAEARFGAGQGFRELLYVNLGTGVSSAWVRDGHPHKGARGNALLIGSSAVDTICPFCGEPHGYVPEEIAGAAGLVAEYRAAGGEAVAAGEVFAAAERGDARAVAVLERAVLALAVNIGLAVNVLDPEALVLGGGLALAGGAYGDALESAIRAHVWAGETRGLPILRARLGADSALIGAAVGMMDLVGSGSADLFPPHKGRE